MINIKILLKYDIIEDILTEELVLNMVTFRKVAELHFNSFS